MPITPPPASLTLRSTDSEYYLHYATSSQLNKLRKPTLVQLLNQLKIDYPTSFDPEDQHQDVELEEMSKQSLLSSLLTAREHQAALSSSPPSSSEVTLNTPKKTATGMSRSTSLPTLPDATPGTTRKAQQQKAPRRVARSISFNDTAEVHVPQHTLRNGKVVQLTALPEEPDSPPHQPVPGPSRLTRSTSRLAQLSAEDHNEEDDDPPTPVAHRTRRTARSSAGSSNDSAGRTLRNGKTVALNQSAEPRESESGPSALLFFAVLYSFLPSFLCQKEIRLKSKKMTRIRKSADSSTSRPPLPTLYSD